jgi:hypothetical protein
MKKRNLKNLKLNKSSVSNLNEELQGGKAWPTTGCLTSGCPTGGCSDGCSPFPTYWNCTKTYCTDNCGTPV